MTKTIKVDPSVSETELERKGEPEGSVPLSRTTKKPEAYSSKPGPK